MANKKETKGSDTTSSPTKKSNDGRKISVIILQQSNEVGTDEAHYVIKKNGEIVKGLSLDKVGEHCKDNNKESIGIILEGFHYSPQQQAALMNTMYTCMHVLDKELTVKPYDVFHPGKVNPNLNIRSLKSRYLNTYGKK